LPAKEQLIIDSNVRTPRKREMHPATGIAKMRTGIANHDGAESHA